MLHFNDLKYYTIPELPLGWKAPTWLMIELGIFAGRLYFQYEEYGDLLRYLGFEEAAAKVLKIEAYGIIPQNGKFSVNEEEPANDDGANGKTEGDQNSAKASETLSFTKKPLTFLQEWLAVRRKGQDFVHTPLGHVCQGKLLYADHPFFLKVENDGVPRMRSTRNDNGGAVDQDAQGSDEDSVFSGDEMHGGEGYYDDGGETDSERDVLGKQFSGFGDALVEDRGGLRDASNRPKKPGTCYNGS